LLHAGKYHEYHRLLKYYTAGLEIGLTIIIVIIKIQNAKSNKLY